MVADLEQADLEQAEQSLTSSGGLKLHWRVWRAPSARLAVAVAHGLGDHSGRYQRLAAALGRFGITCYAVDLRGHGESPGRRGHVAGWQQWVDDFAALYDLATEEAGEQEVVPLGHSFGGAVVASAVIRKAIEPKRFVLSNPAFRLALQAPGWKLRAGRVASGLVPAASFSNEIDPALISRDSGQVTAYRDDALVHDRITARTFTEWQAAAGEALERAGEVTVPVLALLSGADRIIDASGGREFAERTAGPHTVRVYPARYHEPFNDLGANEVFADLAAWLSRPAPE